MTFTEVNLGQQINTADLLFEDPDSQFIGDYSGITWTEDGLNTYVTAVWMGTESPIGEGGEGDSDPMGFDETIYSRRRVLTP